MEDARHLVDDTLYVGGSWTRVEPKRIHYHERKALDNHVAQGQAGGKERRDAATSSHGVSVTKNHFVGGPNCASNQDQSTQSVGKR